ncbi:MAG: ABC transporter ATP-binding protein/permease [Lachnospiraceae bacterium]|nr:ABC transporter ATP-binding protein/permease [Lachnospiraceae bacterium]
MEAIKQKKAGNTGKFANIFYAMKTVYESDHLLLWFTLIKNSMEQIFYVFFFVYLTKYIYDCIEKNIPYEKLFRFLVIACLLHVVIHFMCGWYETYRKIRTPEIYRNIFHKVMELSDELELRDYEDPAFYDTYAKALDRSVDSAMDLSIRFGVFSGNVISSVMALVIVVSVDPVLFVFMIIPIIASFYFGGKTNVNNFNMERDITRDKRMTEYVKRVFYEKKYAAELRLYDMPELLSKKQEEAVDRLAETTLKYKMKNAKYAFFTYGSYSIISGILAFLYVAFRVKVYGAENVGSYVAMVTAMGFASNQLRDAVTNGIFVGNESKLFKNLKDFLERAVEEKEPGEPINEINEIEFRHVSFTYQGAEEPTIRDMSFTWRRGERIALVGYNGAGKTTLVKLLMGLYPVTEGEILVNGTNINKIDLKQYRALFGTVFQDLQVFAMTLAENVLMRTPENDADYEKVAKALSNAQFDIENVALPNGLDSMISREFDENGFVCSGGQAQKIAIARIFANNPQMVILDEPSSALDPLAEYNMYNNMMRLSDGKGVIFISHRLSSARMAHHIFMMKQGQIIESGTHEELLEKHGEYYDMFILQGQNYQESVPEELLKGAQTFYE